MNKEILNKKEYKISKLKHISNVELLNEVKRRSKNKIISRKELLQLAGINWCLECQNNSNEIETNGYCLSCNNNQARML